jgi:hypothetical protein
MRHRTQRLLPSSRSCAGVDEWAAPGAGVVLRPELEQQIRRRQEILEKLKGYRPQDRAERARKQAALARSQMLAGIGATGKRRKAREEALERAEEDARMSLAQERQNAWGTTKEGQRKTQRLANNSDRTYRE